MQNIKMFVVTLSAINQNKQNENYTCVTICFFYNHNGF